MFQCPSTKDCDIPQHTSVTNAIHEKAHKVLETLKELFAVIILHLQICLKSHAFQNIPGEISVTLDDWSSLARDPYLSLHWVHSTPETPAEWSLWTLLLAFCEAKGSHRSENLAKVLMEIINEAGLSSKVSVVTHQTSFGANWR